MLLNPAMRCIILYTSLCLGTVVSAVGSGVGLTSWADTGLQLAERVSPQKPSAYTATPPTLVPKLSARGGGNGGSEEVRRKSECCAGVGGGTL